MDSPSASPQLPMKRPPAGSPEMSSTTKKSKAELKRESISRAKAWAEDRKRKKDGVDDTAAAHDDEEHDKKVSKAHHDDDDSLNGSDDENLAEEQRDVLENLPPTPPTAKATRRTTRRRSASNASDVSSVVSETSTRSGRSLRRRTIDAKAATASAAEGASETTPSTKNARGRPRKSVAPEAVATPTMEEDEQGVDETAASGKKGETPEKVEAKKETPVKSVVEKAKTPESKPKVEEVQEDPTEEVGEKDGIQGEAVKEENKAESVADVQSEGIKVEDKKETTTPMFIQAMLPALSVFLHALLLQWTLAFAVIMTFFSDWFIFEFCADGACVGLPDNGYELTNQRAACANFGLWLVTIAGYSIAFGTYSKVGWILTTSSLAMASFAVKADWLGDANGVTRPVPSLPIYYNVNVPDLLVVLGLIGCIVLMQQPSNEPPENVAHQVANEVEDQEAAPTVEMPDVSSQEIDSSNATKEEQEEKEEVKKEESGPRSLIGQRVAVEKKKKGTCYGTVTEYKHLTREWSVRYDDDGEDEDLNRLELASAFKLHSKDLADYLKAMWRAGEI